MLISPAAAAPKPARAAGWWQPDHNSLFTDLASGLRRLQSHLFIVERDGGGIPVLGGTCHVGGDRTASDSLPVIAHAPPCLPENLGDSRICRTLGIRYPYMGGSMAKGISSALMAEELGRAGMLGFFGAAGLPLGEVEAAVDRLIAAAVPFGCNLIHSPHEPDLEDALTRMYIEKGVRLIEASAFLSLTPSLVRYRVYGIGRSEDGGISAPNRIIAKVSREELAEKFFSPPPETILRELVSEGWIDPAQAELASRIPMAEYITAEADSGGHTDNRPACALFPTIRSLAGRMQEKHRYAEKLQVGLGGGISTPAAAAAAFAMGAAWIMTGSVNQACVESGTSEEVRKMLAEARQADITMAPAADMFEMGVNVQVLKKGTMFPMRAAKLYEIYRSCSSIEEIPLQEREKLEKTLFQAPLSEIWRSTREYFLKRDPRQAERAERDPKHRMALVFRWYLGQAAHWAKDGASGRRIDYQIWCGPAMGAFNEWAAGSCLEQPENRKAVPVALNILAGAATLLRASILRSQGAEIPADAMQIKPVDDVQMKEFLR